MLNLSNVTIKKLLIPNSLLPAFVDALRQSPFAIKFSKKDPVIIKQCHLEITLNKAERF